MVLDGPNKDDMNNVMATVMLCINAKGYGVRSLKNKIWE